MVPFGVFAQFAYAFVVIVRALSLAVDGWDITALHEFIDLSDIAKNASERYEAVSGTTPDEISLKNNTFSNWGFKLRRAKAFHRARFRPALTVPPPEIVQVQGSDYVQPVSGATSTQPLVMPSEFAIDTHFPSFMGFEDFWHGYNDHLQIPVNLSLDFGDT